FAPYLSECRSIAPIGDPSGDWRIELFTGTILVGPLRESEIAFALPIGPEEVVVPLDKLVSLAHGAWTEGGPSAPSRQLAEPVAPEVTAVPALESSEGWFDNGRLRDAKRYE
ncbi:MAG: hypothetical protein H0V89_08395, partial [Deltaproteobacteria bacterium]|nr:hypothetical protein [Deltaproteobacteria bacterium]